MWLYNGTEIANCAGEKVPFSSFKATPASCERGKPLHPCSMCSLGERDKKRNDVEIFPCELLYDWR